ncbi:phosphotransferase [Hazenella sp. IB182357]|uniref:Phosphotransferase n=1 Tax=Polycladospora coralii TaxID=2771432 RepID=A0A926ND25_9BACL|nr:phosphotransferase [Polycladospora coralii]MBD1373585.1 phosphotransferase [Polycladospora coralii]
MMEQAAIKKLLDQFGVIHEEESPTSIYPYAPVFKCKYLGHDVIVKRTRKELKEAEQLKKWLLHLRQQGIQVVTPFHDRPFVNFDGHQWVMYPFIEGRPYNGSKADIVEAGKLLGRIHRQSAIFDSGSFSWEQYDADFQTEIASDSKQILKWLHGEEERKQFKSIIQHFEEMTHSRLPLLEKLDLPNVTASRDYKANNLIYGLDQKPTLIDPDNGGIIPRIVDLAICCIIFHNDGMGTVPPRPLTQEEWSHFMEGYSQYTQLTKLEQEVWVDVLLLLFMDEGLWLIVDSMEDHNPRQKEFAYSLTQFEPSLYKL